MVHLPNHWLQGHRPTSQAPGQQEGLRPWVDELTEEAAGPSRLSRRAPEGNGGPKPTSAALAPAHRARLTCVQVLQQGPEGHGVDLWAETGSGTATPGAPPLAPADAPGGA